MSTITKRFRKKKKETEDEASEYTLVDDEDTMGSLDEQSSPQSEMLKKLDSLVTAIQAQQKTQKEQLEILKKQSRHKKEKIKLKKEAAAPSAPAGSGEIEKDLENLQKELLNPTAISLEDKESSEEFSRDVRRAFQVSTSQLILLVLMVFGYFTVTMIDEYLAPFFWAVILSIILRKPKKILLQLSAPMNQIESEQTGNGFIATTKTKLMYMVNKLKNGKFMVSFVGLILLGKLCCLATGLGCWVPWLSLGLGTVIAIAVVVFFISISKAESLEGFFTTVLVFGFLIILVLFIVMFGFKAITETGDFAFKIQDIVQKKIDDPMWSEMMTEYGITQESISEGIETGRAALDTWATDQGYNITEIEENIVIYGSMLSGNDTATEAIDLAQAVNETALEETSYFDVIPSTEELQEYYETITGIVDMEAVSGVASSIGGMVFSSGAGIFEFFSSIVAYFLGAIDALLQFIVFIGALFFFMESEESFVAMMVKIVPVSRGQQTYLAETIHQNIIQVFVTSALLSISHGVATLIYFSVFGLDFAYSSAFIVGAMALFPLTSPWLIYAPSLLIAYLDGNGYVLYIAIGLFLLEQATGMIDERVYDMIPGSSPYLTGIGLAVGVSTYGVQGILLGPMLIVTTQTLFDIFCINVKQPENEK